MAISTVLLILVVVLVLAALVFGVVSLLGGDDPGLGTAEPDGRALGLPNNRSLTETDLKGVRFDISFRGYRMAQVDRVLRRTAYDTGYKDEMINVLEAEVIALRDGRVEDADLLRKARESAANPAITSDTVDTLDPTADSEDDTADRTNPRAAATSVAERALIDTEATPAPLVDPAADLADSSDEVIELDEAALEAAAAEEAARLEEARQEAATPGRLAQRPSGRKSSARGSRGSGRNRDNAGPTSPAVGASPQIGESPVIGSSPAAESAAATGADAAPPADPPESASPPADRSARA